MPTKKVRNEEFCVCGKQKFGLQATNQLSLNVKIIGLAKWKVKWSTHLFIAFYIKINLPDRKGKQQLVQHW